MEDKEFNRLLKICRIKLNENEYSSIKNDVEEIINYFDSLKSVKTDETNEAFHPILIPEKTAEDIPEEFDDIPAILKNTKTYRFYVVGPEL